MGEENKDMKKDKTVKTKAEKRMEEKNKGKTNQGS